MKKKIIAGAVMLLTMVSQMFFYGTEVCAETQYGEVDLDYKNDKGMTFYLTDEDKDVVVEALEANGIKFSNIENARARILTEETKILVDWEESTAKPEEVYHTSIYAYRFYRDSNGKLAWDKAVSGGISDGGKVWGYGGLMIKNLGTCKKGDYVSAKSFINPEREVYKRGQNFYEIRIYRLPKGDDYEKYVKDPNLNFSYLIGSYWYMVDTDEQPFKDNPFHFKTDKSAMKLSKVTGLKQSKNYFTDKITMSWNDVKGAMGYIVYRSNTKNGTYKYLKTVDYNHISNGGLKGNSKYYYKVRAYTVINGKKVYGAYSDAKSMLTKPAAPTNFVVTLKSRTAKITWAKVAGVQGYELYMSSSRNGSYTRIKNAGASTVSYNKTGLTKGKKYYFKMRAYTKTGTGVKVYSGYSKVKAVAVK